MRTTKYKVVVKIDKKALEEKRSKEGSFYILDHLQDATKNLQYGEVLAIGEGVKEICPEIEIGCIAIFHHQVEYRVVNKNVAEGSKVEQDKDTRFLFHDQNGDDVRYLMVSDESVDSELFAVYKDNIVYPAKGIVFCFPQVIQSSMQMKNGFYINSEEDLKIIKEDLAVCAHNIKEFNRFILQMPYTEDTAYMVDPMKENLIRETQNQKRLTDKLKRVRLGELMVANINQSDADRLGIVPGDIIFHDMAKLYPLDLVDIMFSLIRFSDFIVAKKVGDEIQPIKDYVIIKPDDELKSYNGIIIPDTVNMKKDFGTVYSAGNGSDRFAMSVQVLDHVFFDSKSAVEIFIDDKKHFICHSQNIIYLGDLDTLEKPLNAYVLIKHEIPKGTIEIIKQKRDDNFVYGEILEIGTANFKYKKGDIVYFNKKFAFNWNQNIKNEYLIMGHHIIAKK